MPFRSVGGHAVNFWSLYFLESGVAELADYLPFTSKDLDPGEAADEL